MGSGYAVCNLDCKNCTTHFLSIKTLESHMDVQRCWFMLRLQLVHVEIRERHIGSHLQIHVY